MKWKRAGVLGLITLGATSVAQVADRYGSLTQVEDLELVTLDRRQQAASRQLRRVEGQTEVVIVFFDEEAASDWNYLSPFYRPHLADLINAVSFAGAKTIGLDVYLDRRWDALNAMDGGDDRLHQALADAGNVILVSLVVDSEDGESKVLARPDPYFADVAAGVASADLPTPFETIRDGTLAVRSGEDLAPGFALALYAHARGLDVDAMMAEAKAAGRISLPGLPDGVGEVPEDWWRVGATPVTSAITFPLRFVGPPSHIVHGEIDVGTFQAVASQSAVGLAYINPGFFKDKIVLLGTGFHDSDKFRTAYYDLPYSVVAEGDQSFPADARFDYMYGVEIHAYAVQNFIDEEYLRPLGAGATWVLLLGLSFAAGGLVFIRGAAWGGALTLLLGLGTYAGAVSIYMGGLGGVEPYLWIPIVTPAVALGLSYLSATAYVAIVEGREKRFIRSAFGKYVSPTVVGQISEDPDALKLGGKKVPITVLFSDLAGFTDMSERMDAEELIAHLNEYLSEMTDLVMAEEGTLDKYIGDAIMAFWNAPTPVSDHADRALRCAIFMQRKMDDLNERWIGGDPEAETMVVRIGLNTGEVVVGNVGGKDRFDYSAIGDAVNLGARLEPANKSYGTLVMASENTVRAATRENFRLRVLDFMTVKGKIEPVTVYEVLKMAGVALPPEKEEAIGHYEAGMKAYRGRDWELAREYFRAAVDSDPGDGPSKVYLERSNENIANPPPADWDFVVRRTTK